MRAVLFSLVDRPAMLAALALAILIGHGAWALAAADAEFIRRAGYGLSALGVVATARSFLRRGAAEEVAERAVATGSLPQALAPSEPVRETARDVTVERVWGVGLIAAGELTAGYGDLVAEAFGLR